MITETTPVVSMSKAELDNVLKEVEVSTARKFLNDLLARAYYPEGKSGSVVILYTEIIDILKIDTG